MQRIERTSWMKAAGCALYLDQCDVYPGQYLDLSVGGATRSASSTASTGMPHHLTMVLAPPEEYVDFFRWQRWCKWQQTI